MFTAAMTSFAQTTPDIKTKEDYLKKSRHQKTAAWIMLGGGALLAVAGFGAGVAEGVNYALGDRDPNTGAGSVLATVGSLSMLGSIPLFISASHNKHKAANLTFDMQKVPLPFQNSAFLVKRQPSVKLTISFK